MAASAGDYVFPRLPVEFAGRHPGASFNFTVHNREELLSHIRQNRSDLAITVRPPADLDTVTLPFAPHPRAIVAAADHPLAGVRGSPLATVMREAFVVREKGWDTWGSSPARASASCRPTPSPRNCTLAVRSFSTPSTSR